MITETEEVFVLRVVGTNEYWCPVGGFDGAEDFFNHINLAMQFDDFDEAESKARFVYGEMSERNLGDFALKSLEIVVLRITREEVHAVPVGR
jgi:hypothetical protein